MKFSLKDSIFIFILIVVFIALGFLRDATFMSINSQLYKLYFKNYDYTLPSWLSYFNSWPYMKLYYFKYILTAAFIIFYFLLSIATVYIFTGSFKPIKWVLWAYGIVLILSVFTYFGGLALNHFEKGYLFTRNLTGLLQSPFIIMIIIPALKLENMNSKSQQ